MRQGFEACGKGVDLPAPVRFPVGRPDAMVGDSDVGDDDEEE